MSVAKDDLERTNLDLYDVLFIHEDYFKEQSIKNLLDRTSKIKILISHSNNSNSNYFTEVLQLPASIQDINEIVDNSVIKKSFNKNSSIQIKDYILDKNERKLYKKKSEFILLTEKEIQLLEIFLRIKKPINKNKILEEVWKYVSGVDTHTVETHIYRLRKKIKIKFSDDNFILNDKGGYYL